MVRLRTAWFLSALVVVIGLAIALPLSLTGAPSKALTGSLVRGSTPPPGHAESGTTTTLKTVPSTTLGSTVPPAPTPPCGLGFLTTASYAALHSNYGIPSGAGLCYFNGWADSWVIVIPGGPQEVGGHPVASCYPTPDGNTSYTPPSWCPGSPPGGAGVAVESCTNGPANCTSPTFTRDLSAFTFYPAPDPHGSYGQPVLPHPDLVLIGTDGRCGAVLFDIPNHRWLPARYSEEADAVSGAPLPLPRFSTPRGYTMSDGPLTSQQASEATVNPTSTCPDAVGVVPSGP